MSRPYWETAIAHFDDAVSAFVEEYFQAPERRVLLVAAAGFDPRSRRIADILAPILGDRLEGFFVREERGKPDGGLVAAADANEAQLKELVPNSQVVKIDIFGDDEATVGGARIASRIGAFEIDAAITDVVFDMSALSTGIAFPAARLLLQRSEELGDIAFHIMIASNPELDELIASEPGGRPLAARGFRGEDVSASPLEIATLWIPCLAAGKSAALDQIGRSVGECYKVCPMLPFPALHPRRPDALLAEYETALTDEWEVDSRDLVHASERNPLDCYRTLSALAKNYRDAVMGVFAPSIVISPVGSKVMAAGAFMAALEHELTVQYIETVRYDFDPLAAQDGADPVHLVHLLLAGPAYRDYAATLMNHNEQ
jgi:hypothetical protein